MNAPRLGNGWTSKNAGDMIQLAVFIVGIDVKELFAEINRIHRPRHAHQLVTEPIVSRAMGNICDRSPAYVKHMEAERKKAMEVLGW